MFEELRPATAEEVAETLAYALRFNGTKRAHDASGHIAAIAARRLVEHFERSGFVLMKKPPRDHLLGRS